jgi:hypothetical protein
MVTGGVGAESTLRFRGAEDPGVPRRRRCGRKQTDSSNRSRYYVWSCWKPSHSQATAPARQAVFAKACWIEGNATPLGMYVQFYGHRDEFVVIDDGDARDALVFHRRGHRIVLRAAVSPRTSPARRRC